MTAAGWFCPACQKHHAPHVETCPGPASVEVRPIPGVNVWPIIVLPQTADVFAPRFYPQSGGVSFPYDPNIMIWNGGVL